MPSRSYFSFAKVFISLLPSLSNALPLAYHPSTLFLLKDDPFSITKHEPLSETEFYIYMTASICLVLLGGVFAGLTLGLMGQDEVYLKVIAASGTPNEKRCAKQVLELLDRGKHWLLVTLLLSNVVTNETLPVILDRFLGGGFAAVFSSTVSIVIFGEIIPQSVCVRYGLELGAFFAPYVLVLMYIMYPVAYPIATLLDYILGQDHGTLYRKSGLKTLVNLHHQMGAERLNFDEVTIISAVLDLKAKPVSEIMTPIEKVYTLPSDKILDESTVEEIFNAGYSRIPIHLPEEPHNFVGMLLVRILISYDPDDELPVSSFPLATLPETSLDTSCLNILNYFQEGKSHMVVVSETPGMDTGAKGVLTLEDVIEELIGEEIIDESDVYVDVNKNIKRTIPGPLSKRNFTSYLHKLYSSSRPSKDSSSIDAGQSKSIKSSYIRKDSVENINAINSTIAHGMKPSNLAVNPLQTTNTHITIKKQPQLTSPRQQPSNLPLASNEIDSLIKTDLKNKDYGSSEEPEIHASEASAFVQGLHDNVNRSKENSTPLSEKLDDISSAKRSFLNNTYGIPVPKSTSESLNSTPVQVSNASVKSQNGGITENNIISHRGVSKTIIAENDSVKHSSEDSLIPDHNNKESSNGSNTDLNSKQNKSFWDWK